MKIIILAGGCGTRLWPISSDKIPKQFIKLDKIGRSLFQDTFLRSQLLARVEDIFVVTNYNYFNLIKESINDLGYKFYEDNIILEPESKNTLPAIYAGVCAITKEKDESIVVFPSDHFIEKNLQFAETIRISEKLSNNYIITFGIKPKNPNTQYGYIEPNEKILNGYIVNKFIEKPNYEKAIKYVDKGFYWNSGIFMFNSQILKKEVKLFENDIYSVFENSIDINKAYSKISNKISFDYAILEKSEKVAVVPVDINWNDLGSFDSFFSIYDCDVNGNKSNIKINCINAYNNKIYSNMKRSISAIGVHNLIIIENDGELVISTNELSSKIKQIKKNTKSKLI